MDMWRSMMFPFIETPIIHSLMKMSEISSQNIMCLKCISCDTIDDYQSHFLCLYFLASLGCRGLVPNIKLYKSGHYISYLLQLLWRIYWYTQLDESSHKTNIDTFSNVHVYLLVQFQISLIILLVDIWNISQMFLVTLPLF